MMTKIKPLTCCLLIIFSGNKIGYSQSTVNDAHHVFVRINPTGLTDVGDFNISGGLEYKFNNKYGITLDGGWIFKSVYLMNINSTSGFIIRPGFRTYFGLKNDYYFEIQLHYKQVKYKVTDSLQREINNGVAAYSEKSDFEYKKQVIGYRLLFGRKLALGRTKRFCLEFYAGFGIHYRKGTLVNQPASTEYYLNNPPGYIDMEISKGILPVVPAGIKVAWRI